MVIGFYQHPTQIPGTYHRCNNLIHSMQGHHLPIMHLTGFHLLTMQGHHLHTMQDTLQDILHHIGFRLHIMQGIWIYPATYRHPFTYQANYQVPYGKCKTTCKICKCTRVLQNCKCTNTCSVIKSNTLYCKQNTTKIHCKCKTTCKDCKCTESLCCKCKHLQGIANAQSPYI